MEVDIDKWVLKAAARRMDKHNYESPHASICNALHEMYPELNLWYRVTEQVKEYKKLTMWSE